MAVPSTLTDSYDALLSMTLRNMQPRIRDNITKSNKLYNWLVDKGRFREVDGGERIQVLLMHGLNSTADIFSSYGVLDTTPQEGFTSAFFEWAEMSVSIAISQKEELQNKGRSRLMSLLEAKIQQAEASLTELLNNCLVSGRITASANLGRFLARIGRLDTNAQGPLPLPALVDANPSRSVSIGNINGNTYAFWRNQATSSTASTWAALRKEMTTVYNNCTKGVQGNPDLMLGDQTSHELYWAGLEGKERYIVDDKRVIDVLGGGDVLKFRGADYVWDEVVPDVETNAEVVDGVGTMTTSNIFFLNSQAMEIIVHPDANFMTTPFVRPQDQAARIAQIMWMGAMGVNNRRKLGVLYGISQSIAA